MIERHNFFEQTMQPTLRWTQKAYQTSNQCTTQGPRKLLTLTMMGYQNQQSCDFSDLDFLITYTNLSEVSDNCGVTNAVTFVFMHLYTIANLFCSPSIFLFFLVSIVSGNPGVTNVFTYLHFTFSQVAVV